MSEKKNDAAFFSIRDLNVQYKSGDQTVYAVNGVSFDLKPGETLGLVGETGAGKTTIAKSILRILPEHAVKRMDGEVMYEGQDIFRMNDTDLRKIRGHHISMIFQDPMTALNPVKRVNEQIAEGYIQHHNCSKAEAEKRAEEMLELVGISSDRAGEYLEKSKSPVVINVVSDEGYHGGYWNNPACASARGSVLTLTKEMARELAPKGIRVNCVTHSYIDGDGPDATAIWLTDEEKEKLISATPLKRMCTREDIAGIINFLASDEASFITGAVVPVNGGLTL